VVAEVESTLVKIPLMEHLVKAVEMVDPTLVQGMQLQLLPMMLPDHIHLVT
tara:strand:+ start:1013 stop:1165 length:153 start_codon:yes stop_codon:yes gene_type:complete